MLPRILQKQKFHAENSLATELIFNGYLNDGIPGRVEREAFKKIKSGNLWELLFLLLMACKLRKYLEVKKNIAISQVGSQMKI